MDTTAPGSGRDGARSEPGCRARGAYRGPGLTPHTIVYILRNRHGDAVGRLEVRSDIPVDRADNVALLALDIIDPTPALRLVE